MPKFTAANRPEMKAEIQRLGIAQVEVSDACEVSKATVSAWFSGDVSSPALDKAIPAYVNGVLRGVELAANRAAA